VKYQEIKSKVLDLLKNYLRPEFLNRIDETVVFHPLDKENIMSIAKIQINLLAKRLAAQDIELTYSDDALSKISEHGYDPVYGARPLKRAIQFYIENPLSQKILSGEIVQKDKIELSVDKDGEICFNKINW